MFSHQRPYVFLIKITLFALIISILPLPEIVLSIAPFWLLLFFAYWLTNFPAQGKFFLALLLGVLIDVLYGDILGQNALALILSSAFISNIKQSLVVSNITTQQVYIFTASSIYLGLLLLVHVLSTQDFSFNAYLLFKPFLSALLWPVVQSLLSKLKH
ncbi:Rod shape-determining protein MreD [uncultured Gammaproteobacteria bacterium]|jgi:rod shape-determining protein MreD|uniref:rod shape-determining protein MreD n=1 Tax=thiotrophic endosymbiont of Bathymodiolus puteoserpentis (Logatchev) TaxID=343240 RepID=UPI0010B3795A|nr:rod shape-determining protein MreD [thiotrophic endosymbiont of Bathymodiolus puteoserpentis (Logatchev)]CAC9569261.1 Rod shape-determining protein MreD [uncultured Gammaproteobacteria bacterium]CAC9585835.1 Rod shape-determining protein MreD [uncultured Gammaproteobacteria bacterium]CAC9598232.1 Rod shape-determining protein MreD [uncultured Gammaproteobacteria bacterium]CAC9639397.1 Rod shape-determining protein MreD [uncultured Gammaproteobacteria bacterium]CAC9656384.1 Rod shape-determi